ncbi:MAG: site-2 protease family protein [bacterium]
MVATVILVIIFLIILIVGHEFGHFIIAKLFGMRVDEFGIGFPPKIFGGKIGETEYSINALPFGGFVKIHGENGDEKSISDPRSFRGSSLLKRSLVISGGVLVNIIIAWLAFSLVFMIGIPKTVFVESVQHGTPAEQIGLQFGDEIVGFSSSAAFTSFITDHAGVKMTFIVRREGEELTLIATPRIDPPEGEGRLGVTIIEGGVTQISFFSAMYEGGKAVLRIASLIGGIFVTLVRSLFGGEWKAFQDVSGPVGIFNAVGIAGGMGFVYILQLLGLISVNLAIINIFPFPALDGGRLVFLLFEPIIGKARTVRIESITNAIGFALLIILMVVITVCDIMKIL